MLSIDDIFGLKTEHLTTLQMLARAAVVFFAGLGMLRMSGVRTLGRMTAFDTLTLLIIGSILGRSVISGQNFFGCLLAAVLITLLQLFMAWLTYHSQALGKIFKGTAIPLMREGITIPKHMKRTLVTEKDIEEALHSQLQTENTDQVRDIYLERSGHISFIKKQPDTQ